jgi:NAD(P)-dependent dehydrogenase (short-subunit alcohol dehydrogenase family)
LARQHDTDPMRIRAVLSGLAPPDRAAAAKALAAAVLFLTSGESSFVTGIALAVDGGCSFHQSYTCIVTDAPNSPDARCDIVIEI